MLTKWLIKALKKRLTKMSVEEQAAVRELGENLQTPIDEPKSDTKHKSKKKSKRRAKTMEDEKKVETKVETKETKAETPAAEETGEVKKEEKSEEKTPVDGKTEPTSPEGPAETEGQYTERVGNGIRIEDLVTKEEMLERCAAFEAKYEAIVKENTDLKNELSKAKEESNGLKEKYENKDFGSFGSKGVPEKNKDANETFDSYSKQFM